MKFKRSFVVAVLLAMLMQLFVVPAVAAGSFTFEAENCKLTKYARIISLDWEEISGGKYVGYMIQPTGRFDVTFTSPMGGNLYISPYTGSNTEGVFTAEMNGSKVKFETKPTAEWRVFERQTAFCMPVKQGQNTLAITLEKGGANFDFFEVSVLGEIQKPEVDINTFDRVDYFKNTAEERLLNKLGVVGAVNTKQEYVNRAEFAHMASGMTVDRSYIDGDIEGAEVLPIEFKFDDASKFTLVSGSGGISTQWNPPAIYGMVNASRFKINEGAVNLDDYDTIVFRYGTDPRFVHTTESLYAYVDNDPSKLIASVIPVAADGWDKCIELEVPLNGEFKGVHDIYFGFTPNSHGMRIESVSFKNKTPGKINYKSSTAKSVNYDATGTVFADVKTDTEFANEIEYLKSIDVVKDSVRFRPDDTITIGEAVKIVMAILGYNDENVDDYVIKASRLGLLKGIPYNFNQDMTMKDALKLLTNALTADSLKVAEVSSAGIGYSTDNTVLESLFGVNEIRGKQITATELTSLETANTTLTEGMISLDEVSYKTIDEGYEFLVGFRVNAYVKEDKIVTLTPAKACNIVRIKADDIISADEESIKAYIGSKTKTYKLEDAPRVFLNGRAFTGSLEDNRAMLSPEVGNVYLLSNDGGSDYDTVFIENFDMKVVENAESRNMRLMFRNGAPLELDDAEAAFYMNGEKAEYDSIERGDVVAIGKNGENYVIHILPDAAVSGYVAAMGSDELVIGTNPFETLEGVAAESGVKNGDEITAYLAPGGKIFALYGNGNNYRDNLGLVIDCISERVRGEDFWEILMLTSEGEKIWIETIPEVKVNGETADLEETLRETAVGTHGWNSGEFVQPVKYKLNSEGKITQLFTSAGDDPDLEFNLLTSNTYAHNKYINFYNVRMNKAVMFQIPNADNNEDVTDEEFYQIGDVGETLQAKYLVFGLDSSNYASVVITKYVAGAAWTMSEERNGLMGIFDKSIDAVEVTEKGEFTGQHIFYYEAGEMKSIFAENKNGVKFADDLKKGDMFLIVSIDSNGFAVEKEIYASPQTLAAGPVINYTTSHLGKNSYERYTLELYQGKVVGRNGNEATVWVQNGDSSMEFDENYANTRTIGFAGANIYIYDVAENEIVVAEEKDVAKGDYIVFRENIATVKDVLIIRNAD